MTRTVRNSPAVDPSPSRIRSARPRSVDPDEVEASGPAHRGQDHANACWSGARSGRAGMSAPRGGAGGSRRAETIAKTARLPGKSYWQCVAGEGGGSVAPPAPATTYAACCRTTGRRCRCRRWKTCWLLLKKRELSRRNIGRRDEQRRLPSSRVDEQPETAQQRVDQAYVMRC